MEERFPSRQEGGGGGACVREASAWQPPPSVFCPEPGILVGLRGASKAMPRPAGCGQMGVWRGWVALAQIRSARAHSMPPPHLPKISERAGGAQGGVRLG